MIEFAHCGHDRSKVLTDEKFNRYWYCLACGSVFQASGPSSFVPDMKVREAVLKARRRFPWVWGKV